MAAFSASGISEDKRLRREHQTRDGGCVLQGRTGNLGRIEDSGGDHIRVLFGCGVESKVCLFRIANFPNNDSAFMSCIGSDECLK